MRAARLVFHVSAASELDAQYSWYHARNPVAAHAFRAEIARGLDAILASPGRWPAYRLGTRRLVLRQFPVSIVYRFQDGDVVVLAVAHERRKPAYWTARKFTP